MSSFAWQVKKTWSCYVVAHPAAVLVGADRYDALLKEMEDLKDRLSVCESTRSEPAEPGLRGSTSA